MINPIVAKGRRLALIIISITMIVGTGFTLIFNLWTLILGRLLMGMAVGMYATVCPIFISEYSPPSFSGSMGSLDQFNLVCGLVSAFALAYILPLPDDSDAKTTGLWRVNFIIPGVISLIQFCLLMTVFRYETPLFSKRHS